jgi:polysaccharide biosynthesis transport protein
MRTHQTASPDNIDLLSLGSAVRKSLPKLVVMSALAGAATFGACMMMLPRFTSMAQLEVISTGLNNPFDTKQTGGGYSDVASRMDKEAVGSHVGALKSTDLGLKLVKDLQLETKPEFNAALSPEDLWSRLWQTVGIGAPRAGETDQDRALASYFRALRVFQTKESRAITVEFTSSEPKFSADVSNRLADAYRSSLAGRTIVETEDARVKLAPQIDRLKAELSDADTQINEFRGKANLFRGGTQNTALKDQQLGELTTELSKIQTSRSEADARANAARDMMARGTAEALPDVQKSTLVPRLVEQRVRLERQISELSASLLPAHPRMKQMVADLGGLQKTIKTELQKVVDSIEKDAKIIVDREADIKRRIEDVKKTVVSSSADDGRLRTLEEAAKSKREELSRLQKLMLSAESTVSAKAVPVEVQIVSRAYPASEKSSPKASLLAPLASVATLLLGLAWTVAGELISGARGPANGSGTPQRGAQSSMTEPRDMSVSTPLLAHSVSGSVDSQRLAMKGPNRSDESADAPSNVPSFAANLLKRTTGQSGYRILLTGAADNREHAQEAIALSKALSDGGRHVVLVDWLADDEGLARSLAFSHKPGMTDLLQGESSFEDVIQTIGGSNAHFIATGTTGATAETGDADRANLVLDALDEAYEFIIVHSTNGHARDLFSGLQGRFDAGVIVQEGRARQIGAKSKSNFLGFDVPDMDIVTIDAIAPASTATTIANGLERRPMFVRPKAQANAALAT